jgi:hypothetical protein
VQKADQQRLDELGLRRWRNQQMMHSQPRQS